MFMEKKMSTEKNIDKIEGMMNEVYRVSCKRKEKQNNGTKTCERERVQAKL